MKLVTLIPYDNHSFIHPFSFFTCLFLFKIIRNWCNLQWLLGERLIHPGQVSSSSLGHMRQRLTFYHTQGHTKNPLYRAINNYCNLVQMFLNCRRTLKYLEEFCKLQAERSYPQTEPAPLIPTAPPCSPGKVVFIQ